METKLNALRTGNRATVSKNENPENEDLTSFKWKDSRSATH